MDAYTLHLLGMAVEACDGHLRINRYPDGWEVSSRKASKPWPFHGSTFADALTSLLTDLSVEVPERPSAERVRRVRDEILHAASEMGGPYDLDTVGAMGDHPDRLTVLALLEGEA